MFYHLVVGWVCSYLRALSTSFIRGILRGIFRLASYLRGVTSLSSFLRGTPCLRSLYNGRMLYLDIFYIFSTQSSLIVFIVLLIPISGFFRIVIALKMVSILSFSNWYGFFCFLFIWSIMIWSGNEASSLL